tara:strand:- start:2639 stop:3643 length:1005 start_codon:yes stop_codon:yes gene_type:complete
MGKRFDDWLAEQKAAQAERKAARQARREKRAQERADKENAEGFIENLKNIDLTQERVDINDKQHFYFPEDLQAGANQGYPFIRFGIKNNNGDDKVAIYLYHPPGLSVTDGANYSGFNAGVLKAGLIGAQKMFANQDGSISEADLFATALIARDKRATPGSTIEKITSSAALKAGVATNPYTRTAFETTNIRGYQFAFKLVASNAEESAKIVAIERTFRKFLYPKRMGSIALVYPPLFHISFYAEGRINNYLPKIKPCYLTTLDSVFNATSNTFHQDTGAPVEVDLTLTFQEERVLVRQDLYPADSDIDEADGYYQEASTGGDDSAASKTKTNGD